MGMLVLPRTLDAPVSALPKLQGPDAKRLGKLGVSTIRDLLLTLPFGWETYGAPTGIASLAPGAQATVVGTIASIALKVTRFKKMKLTEATIRDDSGAAMRIVW